MRWFILILVLSSCVSKEKKELKARVESSIEEINTIREGLVQALPSSSTMTPKVFKSTCGPVGKKAKELSTKLGLPIRQASNKYRNPKHKATALEQKALDKFEKNKKLTSFWLKESGAEHYFRRINVQESCLACHGKKSKRPEFIKSKYSQDKAFDFKAGDLRGLYHAELKN